MHMLISKGEKKSDDVKVLFVTYQLFFYRVESDNCTYYYRKKTQDLPLSVRRGNPVCRVCYWNVNRITEIPINKQIKDKLRPAPWTIAE